MLANLAAVFILALGIIAALNQVGIATTVTTPVLIAFLATVAGILIIGVGGGLVKPMQSRWEGWLNRMAEESRAIREQRQAQNAGRGAQTTQVTPPTSGPGTQGRQRHVAVRQRQRPQQFHRPNP